MNKKHVLKILGIIRKLAAKGYLNWLPDKSYLQLMYFACLAKRLNLVEPVGFNEKMQWLKLYNRNPLYIQMVDKYEVKKYVADIIGTEYIIPTLGVWDCVEDVAFDDLGDQFVLKCTHDSGGLVVCRDKSLFDVEGAKQKLRASLQRNYFYWGREWPYKNIKPRIIAEQYMVDYKLEDLRDYKWYCFGGEPRLIGVFCDRASSETTGDFFDMKFVHQDIVRGYPNAKVVPEKPANFELMKTLAKKLSQGIPFVRVDFYEANGNVYFGELTFFASSGFSEIQPDEWDLQMGEWITLPSQKKR